MNVIITALTSEAQTSVSQLVAHAQALDSYFRNHLHSARLMRALLMFNGEIVRFTPPNRSPQNLEQKPGFIFEA